MGSLRRLIFALILLAAVAAAFSLLFFAALTVFAIVAPLIGVSYLGLRSTAAVELWRSHGRFQIGDGVRIISAGRARVLGLLSMVEGVAGFGLSFVPALLVFSPGFLVVPLLGTALATLVASRVARRRVMEASHPVDVLPPV
jgi:hypothetical protein